MLGKQADMLPQGYQNIKRRIHRWFKMWLNVVAPRLTLNGKFWTPVGQYRKANDYQSYIHQQTEAGTKHT